MENSVFLEFHELFERKLFGYIINIIRMRKCRTCPYFKCRKGSRGLCMHPDCDRLVQEIGHYPYRRTFHKCRVGGRHLFSLEIARDATRVSLS